MSSDDIKKELEELTALLAEVKQQTAPIQELKANLDAEEKAAYKEYQEKVAKVRAKKLTLDEDLFEAQRKLNKLAADAERKQRELKEQLKKEAEEAEALERELANLVLIEKWDRLTAAAPWREWAKDHQLSAGHKIVMDRNVILADVMGLGKTLSSIITCDMAQAATKLASPKFPFLGEEVEKYHAEHYLKGDDPRMYRPYELSNNERANPEAYGYTHVPAGYSTVIENSITRPVGKRILYFCPSPMIKNVEREFRMWAPHRSVIFIGGMTKAEREYGLNLVQMHEEFVVICNYEAWRRDKGLIESLSDIGFDTVIVDEAHNVKELKTSAYRGIKSIIDNSQPEYVIPMTGTPILNRPQELFALLTLVSPKKFYRMQDFLWDYCEQDDEGFWKFKPGGLDRIAKAISKNFLRRTKDQAGIVLPPKTVTVHTLQVDLEKYPEQGKVRESMRKEAMIQLKDNKAIGAAAMIAVFTRLRQIETWPAGIKIELKDKINGKWVVLDTTQVEVYESQKLDYLIEPDPEAKTWNGLIPEVIEDERIVVFSQFKAPLHELQDRIHKMGRTAVILDGDTPKALLEEAQMDFDNRHRPNRADAKWDVALCNYKVGGVGANMTAATQMFILDEEWNPGKRDQAYDRIHRMGQDKPVSIHVIRNEKTIDDWLANIMAKKEDVVDGFNNTMINVDEFQQFLEDGGLM